MRFWGKKKIHGPQRVGIGVASFLNEDGRRIAAFRAFVASFQAQTWKDWQMLVLHDGKIVNEAARAVVAECVKDSRVRVIETKERVMKFGHPHRQRAIDDLCVANQWLLLTNDDNLYMPVFLEALLFRAVEAAKPGCGLVYCDCVHSHIQWKLMVTEPRYKKLDLGGFLVRTDFARRVPFDNHEFNGDGDWINRLAAAVGVARIRKVASVLFVHN